MTPLFKKTYSKIFLALALWLSLVTLLVPSAFTAEFWASKQSNKYHYPECQWAQKIKPTNLIIFASPEEAQRSGYVPCKVCSPPISSRAGGKRSGADDLPQPQTNEIKEMYCVRVIDGDTIVVSIKGRQETVRLIGIDAPESQFSPKAKMEAERTKQDLKSIYAQGEEATRYVKTLVKKGDKV